MMSRSRVRTYPEQFDTPGAALYRAWLTGLIDRNQYEAGKRLTSLWQGHGADDQEARVAAARAILSINEAAAYIVASVCRDNGGVGNSYRASLLKEGLSHLASHFAFTGGRTNV